jgi:hypothetical protein
MMTPYERLRRGERSALAPLVQAVRSGRYPSVLEFAALAVESGGRSDSTRAEILEYERALRAEAVSPETGLQSSDDAFGNFMATLKAFRL